MLSVVKIPLKGEVVGRAFNSHENYIVDHGKSWKNHGKVFLNFNGNPVIYTVSMFHVGYHCKSDRNSEFLFKLYGYCEVLNRFQLGKYLVAYAIKHHLSV